MSESPLGGRIGPPLAVHPIPLSPCPPASILSHPHVTHRAPAGAL